MSDFDKLVAELEGELRANLGARPSPSLNDEWLGRLYDNYHRRFLADNAQVWGNGRVLVPFSLSAFGVWAALPLRTIPVTAVLAAGSTTLAALWLVNAENHRAFQNKSMAWLVAIERVIGVKLSTPQKISDGWFNKALSRRAAVQKVIRTFCFGVPLAWIAILLFQILTGWR